jgi:hypothetical protein
MQYSWGPAGFSPAYRPLGDAVLTVKAAALPIPGRGAGIL